VSDLEGVLKLGGNDRSDGFVSAVRVDDEPERRGEE
jgi:hypothetical protein